MINKKYINKLSKENIDYVNSVIQSNKDIYGENPLISEMEEYTFYEIKREDKLLGFFAIGDYLKDNHELVLAYVFIKKQFRREGCFKSIIEFAKNIARQVDGDMMLDINASITNQLANEIYSKYFKSMGKDKIQSGELVNWYNIYTTIPEIELNRLIEQYSQTKELEK